MSINQLLFSAKGRISRRIFWLFLLAITALRICMAYIDIAFGTYDYEYDFGLFSTVFTFLSAIPIIFVSIKRFHDRADSGWNTVMLFVPILNLFFGFMLAFMPGTNGPNKYGPDPRKSHVEVVTDEPLVDKTTRDTTYGI